MIRKFTCCTALLLLATLIEAVPAKAEPPEGFEHRGDRWTYDDGRLKITGVLFKPEGDGPFPAVVISHGLGGSASRFGANKAREFVDWGMVCIACDYTHSRESLDAEQRKRLEGGDAENAAPGKRPGRRRRMPANVGASDENLSRASKCIDLLESLPYVDKNRIAAFGNSMGAFVTIGLAAREPTRLKAAAITAGGISPRGGFAAPTPEVASKIGTPIIIFHGAADTVVRPEQSALLKSVLDDQKVANERHVFEGVDHAIERHKPDEVYRLTKQWFERHGVLSAD